MSNVAPFQPESFHSQSALYSPAEPRSVGTSSTLDQTGSGAGNTIDPLSHTSPAVTPSANGQALVAELESAVERFRKGESTKTEAVSTVLQILRRDTDVSDVEPQTEATFDSYLAEILSIQPPFSGRAKGKHSAHVKPCRPDVGGTHGDQGEGQQGHESDESDCSDSEDRPSKRQRLAESDMPWYNTSDRLGIESVHPSSQETSRLLRAYNKDVAKAKFYVKVAHNSPSGVPSSQWERIFKGDAVDLNQFFASLHHVVADEERKGRLGDTEISLGVVEAKKQIRTAAEWSSAWRRASKAIAFAFPHRRDELAEYGDYIEGEFAAKLPSSHNRILLYDIALRNEVGAGQHTLLTQTHRFSRLYSAIVMPDGIETHSKPGKKSSDGHPKTDACNKFNNGTCKASDTSCKYRHICKKCGKGGHAGKDCSSKSE